MCTTKSEIEALSNESKSGKISERDLCICRRLLCELYNRYPEVMPFRDCAELNFKEYLDVIPEPIALDVIKERLDSDSPTAYVDVRQFLKDLRSMFSNCYTFHPKESSFFAEAKKLEECLDRQVRM